MEAERCREMQLLLQADLDGELTPAEAARAAAHLEGCADCQAAREELLGLSARVRAAAPAYGAPAALRAAIEARLPARQAGPAWPRARPWRPRVSAFLSFGGGAALAACVALALVPRGGGLPEAVVSDHIRSLQPGHLMDVASSDQHTVKPWFDGRLAFAPAVKDLKADGFPLAGGRLDYLAGRPVAALIYGSGQHVVQLFVWPAGDEAGMGEGSRNGYNFVRWAGGGMTYWAVSDLNAKELGRFVRLWQASS